MSKESDVDKLESDVYRSRFDDGSVEIFLGLSLIWIGSAWVFLPDFAGLAGVLPAVFVAPFVTWRTKFLESRLGYVRFGPERRSWERKNLLIAILAGVAILLLGVGVYLVVSSDRPIPDMIESLLPGLIAFLLAAFVAGLGLITGAWRLYVVAAVLVIGGVVAAIYDTNPGAPLIPAGFVAAIWGTVMLVGFTRQHSVVESL